MTIEEKVVKSLNDKGLVLATAESCTGGFIAKRITDVRGSSGMFNCGIVSYSNEIKESVLGVSHETLEKYGAVSEQTVSEMVQGVLKISNADIAVAVSGIAGPDSDNTQKPVGLIYIAISNKESIDIVKLSNTYDDDIRNQNRISASDKALEMILEMVGE